MLHTRHLAFHRLLVLTDVSLLGGSVLLANHLAWRYRWSWVELPDASLTRWLKIVQVAVMLGAWAITTSQLESYRSRRTQSLWREVAALGQAWFAALAAAALIGQALHGGVAFAPILCFPLGLLVLTGSRAAMRYALYHLRVRGFNYRRALFVGGGESASAWLEEIERHPQYGIRIVGGIGLGTTARVPDGVAYLGGAAELQRVMADNQIDYVLLCPPADAASDEIARVFALCNEAGIGCHYSPYFVSLRNLAPSVTWYGDLPALSFHARAMKPWQLVAKRAMDVVGAAAALVLLSPLLLAIALAIYLYDRGPVFFAQERVGLNGRRFRCLKFRSMCVGAEQMRAQLEQHNEQDGPAFKLDDDPRVTPVGRLLRRYSLDELPQLFNVLVGHMSLVGPRPPIPTEVARYDWWQRRRVSVPQGLTCIWQVWGRPHRVSFQQWMEMDLYYVDHWSLWLDVKLMLRTVGAVVRGTGS